MSTNPIDRATHAYVARDRATGVAFGLMVDLPETRAEDVVQQADDLAAFVRVTGGAYVDRVTLDESRKVDLASWREVAKSRPKPPGPRVFIVRIRTDAVVIADDADGAIAVAEELAKDRLDFWSDQEVAGLIEAVDPVEVRTVEEIPHWWGEHDLPYVAEDSPYVDVDMTISQAFEAQAKAAEEQRALAERRATPLFDRMLGAES